MDFAGSQSTRSCGSILIYATVLFSGGEMPIRIGWTDCRQRFGRSKSPADAFEIQLARMALATGKPALGICRGCQILSIADGARSYKI